MNFATSVFGMLKIGIPVTNETTMISSNVYFAGNITIALTSYSEEALYFCVQEGPLPMPNFNSFSTSCTYAFRFNAYPNPHPNTTTGHTAPSTTGVVTTGPGESFKPNANKNGGRGFSKNIGDNSNQTFSFPPRSTNYVFGVYYATTVPNHKTFNISFSLTGQYCVDKIGDDCSIPISPLPQNTTVEVTPGTTYYSTMIKSATVNHTISNLLVNFKPNATVNVYARYSGIPSKTVNEISSTTGSITIVSPVVGNWYFAVEVANPTSMAPTSVVGNCVNNTAGVNCNLNVLNANALPKLYNAAKFTKAGDMNIYAFSNTSYQSLYVSLNDQAATKRAMIYASWNRVPLLVGGKMVGNDISGCNNQYCAKVQSISARNAFMNRDNGTWYITVVAGRDANDYSIWFNFICPSNCSGFGVCQTTGDSFGVCKCEDNYDGLQCNPNNMLIEYIILIIIAALVLVSALLGLIAWAYMRRRAQYVEVR